MNWAKFQTRDMAPDKSFEMLCNQLFENWCREEYGTRLTSFSVVNGAGGDGGVESYAVLSDGSIVGLQAKWFQTSMGDGQISQIKNSIHTAIKVRPQITDYIVCVPRDLASTTARSANSEASRWDKLLTDMKVSYPSVNILLWNNTRLVEELQKPKCSGIYKFWFENSEISCDSIKFAFDKAKTSWLESKYAPPLNTYGRIANAVCSFLGHVDKRAILAKKISKISSLCTQYKVAADALLLVCCENDTSFKELLETTNAQLDSIHNMCNELLYWLENESVSENPIEANSFNVDFESLADQIYRADRTRRLHFHVSEVTKVLKRLSEFDFYQLLQEIEAGRSNKSILFLGNPGTGKTHGVSAIAEKLLLENFHVPLLIRARSIPPYQTWKDIISNNLGLSSVWNEEEIWQGLTSLANRNLFSPAALDSATRIRPKVFIIIDGLDESSPQDRWVERIKETDSIVTTYPQIRFCFTSRPTVMPKPVNYAKVIRLGSGGDVPAFKLFDRYMQAYNITAHNRGWLRNALSTPLALKLFCELNQNKTVSCSNRAEISMAALWRKKVDQIEKEYAEKTSSTTKNQYVLKSIVHLSKIFLRTSECELSSLIEELKSALSISNEKAECLVTCLENYGVLSCGCEWGSGISPNIYNYYPGIQGYFDYATAIILLEQNGHPKDIDFNKYPSIDKNALNGLAVLAIQNYDYLITRNTSICAVLDEWNVTELQFLTLQHTNHTNSLQFVNRSLEIMGSCADGLTTIVNKLILPLSRDQGHPLGVSLIDNFLGQFEKPAQRDILWSTPGYLHDAVDTPWYQSESLALQNEDYVLSEDDLHDGCPTIYAWALATVNNSLRKLYRDRLMVWARLTPNEFYKLFLKFSTVNDPQIKSDLFSILMCLLHDVSQPDLLNTASSWVMANILHPDKIDSNRDVSIRYYSIAIVKKAIYEGLISEEAAKKYLPPYRPEGYEIPLNKDALQGTRMGGYKAIDYDLSRYVLIDHFHSVFTSYRRRSDKQLDALISRVSEIQPDYKNISFDQFILSTAYAYVLNAGWNEDEFYNLNENSSSQKTAEGVDISILRTYSPATHGSMSSVMTVCEKYVWQARNVISGFLCDRLLFGDNAIELEDYGLLDDFIIPSHEIAQVNPDYISDDRPWHIPEPKEAILNSVSTCREDVVAYATDAPLIDWKQWVFIENTNNQYHVNGRQLVALDMSSCFLGTAGVETNLFINAILVAAPDVAAFVEALDRESKQSAQIANPPDWYGGAEASCYISPKEICCFPWKTRYECSNIEKFPQFSLLCAVDSCCYNTPEFGDVYYYLPSTIIRKMMKIIDTDGYLFTDANHQIVAEYAIAGEKWGTRQTYLLLEKDTLFEHLKKAGLALVWIMKERRSHSGLSLEKYGEFGVDHMRCFAGYFEGNAFCTREIRTDYYKNLPSEHRSFGF